MAWGKGHPRASTAAHKAWRLAVLERDAYTCTLRIPGRCIVTATEADHIVPFHQGGAEHDPDNGRAACRPCHAKHSSEQGLAARPRQGRAQEKHPGLT